MRRDFEIKLGIYLVQAPHELDLHNNFDFQELRYSVAERILYLQWCRSEREGIPTTLPISVTIEFRGVTEFRFQPRDLALPFTEDDCLTSFGYWTDEDWADGVIMCEPSQTPDPSWSHPVHVWRCRRSSGRLCACNHRGLTRRWRLMPTSLRCVGIAQLAVSVTMKAAEGEHELIVRKPVAP